MESENWPDPYEDNRDVLSRQSVKSTKNDLQSDKNHKLRYDEEEKQETDSRSNTRVYHSDPDRDQISDDEDRRSKKSYSSEDYESPSEHSLSPYSRSRSPSPLQQSRGQTKRVSSSPPYKTGSTGRRGAPRPQRNDRRYVSQQLRRGARSSSKEPSPSKDLDLVTKRMLSARLLKINELRNALTELQQRTNELQKENRVLRQLQVRQEKALQRYDDTESEISQLISRHSNETHVLRERLRRTQERERTVERRLKDSEEQLQRSQNSVARLKKLVDQRGLGQREELTRKLDEEKGLRLEAEHKIKDLERSIELSSSSFQRQIVAEKKKTVITQEEVRTLQEELERLTLKLKEKERELDAKNIYANRMLKLSQRKDAPSGTKRKLLSRMSTVAVQTEDILSSLDFPTPPPAITDAIEYDYLSLKELNKDSGNQSRLSNQETTNKVQQKEKAKDLGGNHKLQQLTPPEPKVYEESPKFLNDERVKDVNEDVASPVDQQEEKSAKPGHVREEVQRRNQEALTNQQAAEEARRKRDHLLAKMHEIDQQNQSKNNLIFNEPRLTSQSMERSPNTSVFSLTQADSSSNTGRESRPEMWRTSEREGGGVTTAVGRRSLRTQNSAEDLAFGSYAPSFGNTTPRGISNYPLTPPTEDKVAALEAIGVFSLKKTDSEKEDIWSRGDKERKANLMQQLFGDIATTNNIKNNKDLFTTKRDGPHHLHSGQHSPPTVSKSTIHITETRPAVCAITSFDDDIEELAL